MSPSDDQTNLQFDRAEFADGQASRAVCRFCQRAVGSNYFEVNSQLTCPACRDAIAREQAKTAGVRGVGLAIVAGLGAGFVGALIYYAVLALTGYEFALISIAVGYLVGRAVRWASGNRGGRVYQVIAVLITYVAIAGSYAPIVIGEITKDENKHAAAPTVAGEASSATAPKPDTPVGTATPAPAAAPTSSARGKPAEPLTLAGFAIALAVLLILLLAAPVLAGIQSILGLIIIGVALWEAWKITRRVQITVEGPFTLTTPDAAPAPADATLGSV